MPELSRRTKTFTDSVIRRMTRVSLKYGAVNLSQGFPDFEPPKEILDRLAAAAKEDFHQYSITWGAQNFREALAEKQSKFMGRKIDPDREIVVTCGSTEAMMVAMMTVTNPGDKVIVFSPFYENYGADAILSGAEPVYVLLYPPAFHFDADELEAAFRQRPKALILCNPSNPCGKVFTYDELKLIAELAEKYDAFVITDEVYEHIVYKPYRHVYFSSLQGMYDRTISCSSLSKTYSITGWRLGYVIAPPHIVDVAKKVHDFLTVGAAAPLQEAAVLPRPFSSSTSSINRFCISGSRPLVGSSSINISGSCIKAATMPTFCFIPLLIFFSLLPGFSSKRSSSSLTRALDFILRYFAKKDKNSVPFISSKNTISPGI